MSINNRKYRAIVVNISPFIEICHFFAKIN